MLWAVLNRALYQIMLHYVKNIMLVMLASVPKISLVLHIFLVDSYRYLNIFKVILIIQCYGRLAKIY